MCARKYRVLIIIHPELLANSPELRSIYAKNTARRDTSVTAAPRCTWLNLMWKLIRELAVPRSVVVTVGLCLLGGIVL
ncbi:hypothetical protein ACS0TY_026441 [Phlomoides rotata]